MTQEFDVNDFFKTIVDLAIENNASDIHITPFKFDCFIRFRIAG
jgi:type II secretory ATPase GspE/PulE/Tfp pilus assembly ATPase PilB-like protein